MTEKGSGRRVGNGGEVGRKSKKEKWRMRELGKWEGRTGLNFLVLGRVHLLVTVLLHLYWSTSHESASKCTSKRYEYQCMVWLGWGSIQTFSYQTGSMVKKEKQMVALP